MTTETTTRPAAQAVLDSPPSDGLSTPCPLGCGRPVAASGGEIHFCVIKVKMGRRAHAYREYVGTFDGAAICFEPTYHDAELIMQDHQNGLFADGLIDAPPAIYACMAAPVEEFIPGVIADTPALYDCPCQAPTATDGPDAVAGPVALVGAVSAPLPDTDEARRAALTADAWMCGAGHVFWTTDGRAPLTCPRCGGLAAISPVSPVACTNCAGAHPAWHCPEITAVRQGMVFWENYIERRAAFLNRVRCAPAPTCAGMAQAVAAYLTARMGGELTAAAVLHCWAREIAQLG
jgi:hypothetical protein